MDILFGLIPAVIVIAVIFSVIRGARGQKENKSDKNFDEIYDKMIKDGDGSDKEITDKDIEDELVRRFNAYSNSDTKPDKNSSSHDEVCIEDDCDGCGADDVYAQVYGKRKKNKLKNKN